MRFARLVGAAAVAVGLMAADSPVGTWRGESLCTPDAAAACKNEKVVYYIRAIAGNDGSLLVQADKIVDGKAITMGTGPWRYDRDRQTLTMEPPETGWVGHLQGKRIEATLVRGGVLLRRMTLVKDE